MGLFMGVVGAGNVIRLALILLLMVVVGLGPLVFAFLRHMNEPEVRKSYRDHHDPLALARLERRHGHITDEEYLVLEQTHKAPTPVGRVTP